MRLLAQRVIQVTCTAFPPFHEDKNAWGERKDYFQKDDSWAPLPESRFGKARLELDHLFLKKQRSWEPLAWTDKDLQGSKATEPGTWKPRACLVQAPLSCLLNRDKPQDSGSRMISVTP